VGVPSSWASAHYTSNGMNHGGFDEKGQGDTNMRLLSNIKNTGLPVVFNLHGSTNGLKIHGLPTL
jgi:hypothetical protein